MIGVPVFVGEVEEVGFASAFGPGDAELAKFESLTRSGFVRNGGAFFVSEKRGQTVTPVSKEGASVSYRYVNNLWICLRTTVLVT